jgi:DNA-binding MarR family transcriptional regulator
MIASTLMAMAQAPATATDRIPYGLMLARLGQEVTARFRCSLRPLNLSAQQYFVLKQLEALGPSAQSALADSLGIDPSNMATVTAELQRRELIERVRDDSDRRRYVCELTQAGVQLLADADTAMTAGEDALLEVLDDEEREALRHLLSRMVHAVDPGVAERTVAETCQETAG